MNALSERLRTKTKELFSVFFTAGFPHLNSTEKILLSLQRHGVDFVEIGIPYSDPLADGPVIQYTNTVALQNGMSLDVLFSQLEAIKKGIDIPIILMGYLNPVLQYGIEKFCKRATQLGVSGVILPDMPLAEYQTVYRALFMEHKLHMIFLVTPTTREERIRQIDEASTAFIYAVSTSSTTGTQSKKPMHPTSQADKEGKEMRDEELFMAERDKKNNYLKRLRSMQLTHPIMVGFGIHDRDTLSDAWEHANGAIVGTAFLNGLIDKEDEDDAILLLKQKTGIV